MEIPITYYLYLSITIFTIGLIGVFLNRKNLIILLMSIELIFLSSSINFVAFSNLYQDLVGQVFVFFILKLNLFISIDIFVFKILVLQFLKAKLIH